MIIPQITKLPALIIGGVMLVMSMTGITPEAPQPEINWDQVFSELPTEEMIIEINREVVDRGLKDPLFELWIKAPKKFIGITVEVSRGRVMEEIIKKRIKEQHPEIDVKDIFDFDAPAHKAYSTYTYGETGLWNRIGTNHHLIMEMIRIYNQSSK